MSHNLYEYTCETWKIMLNKNLVELNSNLPYYHHFPIIDQVIFLCLLR